MTSLVREKVAGQTDRKTDRQVIWHDASRSQWQEYVLEIGDILHIFPSGTQSMGDRGSKKAYTGPRTDIYLPTKFGCDRQTDKQNGITIRLTLCERDATDQCHSRPIPPTDYTRGIMACYTGNGNACVSRKL